jgi:hypothetical protein
MKNAKLIAILLTVTLLLAVTACEPPVEKYVGSNEHMMSVAGFPTFDDFVLISDRIAIGKIESAEVREGYFHEPEEDDIYPPPTYTETRYTVIVDETLTGNDSDSLILCLFGTPDSDFGMTKPHIGDNVMLFLAEARDGLYAAEGFEMGIFIIRDDNTVYSLHDDKITAQFDGKSLDVLKNEVTTILDEGDFSERYYSMWVEEYQEELRERVEQHRRR